MGLGLRCSGLRGLGFKGLGFRGLGLGSGLVFRSSRFEAVIVLKKASIEKVAGMICWSFFKAERYASEL